MDALVGLVAAVVLNNPCSNGYGHLHGTFTAQTGNANRAFNTANFFGAEPGMSQAVAKTCCLGIRTYQTDKSLVLLC